MAPLYEMSIETWFSAAHWLRDYQGPCATLHGHNWKVQARVTCRELDELGMGIDFCQLKRILDEAVKPFDHACLNELPPFHEQNPTAETIARHLYAAVSAQLPKQRNIALCSIAVTESTGFVVIYREE